jgi:hypothetical protein
MVTYVAVWPILIPIAFLIGFYGFFYMLYEYFKIARFDPTIFEKGKVVFRLEEPFLTLPTHPLDVVQTENSRFKFVSDRACLFGFRGAVRVRTICSLKGKIEFQNGMAYVSGRLLHGETIFFVAQVAAWTLGGLLMSSIPFILAVWGLAILIFFPSLWLGKQRLIKAYNQIKEYLI